MAAAEVGWLGSLALPRRTLTHVLWQRSEGAASSASPGAHTLDASPLSHTGLYTSHPVCPGLCRHPVCSATPHTAVRRGTTRSRFDPHPKRTTPFSSHTRTHFSTHGQPSAAKGSSRPRSHALTSDSFKGWTPRLPVWSGEGAVFPIHVLPSLTCVLLLCLTHGASPLSACRRRLRRRRRPWWWRWRLRWRRAA